MVSCQQVLHELSAYIDGTAESELRQSIEEHLHGCRRCSVVLDTTRKVLVIYADEEVLEVPAGYTERLRASFLNRLSQLNQAATRAGKERRERHGKQNRN